jgi:hypothetical protein
MLIKTQLSEDAFQAWIRQHRIEVNSKVIAIAYRKPVQYWK